MILGIDAGTTGVRTFAIDDASSVVRSAYREFPQYFPQPGWVEHDPEEIWDATLATLTEVVRACEDAGDDVAAIGITNQRETTVVWNRATGRPLHRAIVWQDRRTAHRCDELRAAGHEPLVRERTGLVLDPYFSATKLAWLLTEGGVERSTPTSRSAPSTRGCSGSSPAARCTRPSRRTRAARCCSTSAPATGPTSSARCSTCPRAALGDVLAHERSLRHHRRRRRRRAHRAGERDGRRPAVGAVRAGVLRAGDGQEHLRHRLVRAREPRPDRAAARGGPAHDRRLEARRRHHVRDGGRDLRDRRRGAVAARRAADHRARRRDRAARRERARRRRRDVRPGVHRARLALLGPVRARHRARPHARAAVARSSRAPRWRRWRTRPPTSSTRCAPRRAPSSPSSASTAARA